MRARRSLVALALGIAGACTAPERAAPPREPASTALVPIHLPGVEEAVLAGRFEVPENRAVAGGRRLSLKVIVVPALHPQPGRAPLLFLEGGPGAAATQAAPWFLEASFLRENREIVLVDARGTGGSGGLQFTPASEQPLLDALGEMYPPAWVERNRDALAAVADLSCYTTADVVEDLEEVRAWLGCEQFDLLGLSYGTRVALEYLRRHSSSVRAAVLEGVAPAGLDMPMQHAPAGQHALEAIFAECAADPACAARFPDLPAALTALLARLAAQPASVDYAPAAGGPPLQLTIRGDVFAESLRQLLYTRITSRFVPLLVQRASEGDFTPWLRIVEAQSRRDPDSVPLADGFYLCVTCAEDVPFIDSAEAERLAQGTWFGDYRVLQQRRACALWPVEPVDAAFREPVRSEVPVLILSGALDPVTPPEFGAEVARHLPNARQIVIPRMGHMEDGLSHLECFDELMQEFFERGSAAGLDASCVESLQPPPFVLDESELPGRRG
jgi:pimeloyl-ACP methyl ester carboxylesterase